MTGQAKRYAADTAEQPMVPMNAYYSASSLAYRFYTPVLLTISILQ